MNTVGELLIDIVQVLLAHVKQAEARPDPGGISQRVAPRQDGLSRRPEEHGAEVEDDRAIDAVEDARMRGRRAHVRPAEHVQPGADVRVEPEAVGDNGLVWSEVATTEKKGGKRNFCFI